MPRMVAMVAEVRIARTAATGHHDGVLGLRCLPLSDSVDGAGGWAAVFTDHPWVVAGHVSVAGEAGVVGAVSAGPSLFAHVLPLAPRSSRVS